MELTLLTPEDVAILKDLVRVERARPQQDRPRVSQTLMSRHDVVPIVNLSGMALGPGACVWLDDVDALDGSCHAYLPPYSSIGKYGLITSDVDAHMANATRGYAYVYGIHEAIVNTAFGEIELGTCLAPRKNSPFLQACTLGPMTVVQIIEEVDMIARVMVQIGQWQGNAIWCDDGALSGAFTRRVWDTGYALTASAGVITAEIEI